MALSMVLPVKAEASCDARPHIDQLRQAGWYVVAEDIGCAVSLVPRLADIIARDSVESRGRSLSQVLADEGGAGPICVSLAWQQVKQGCTDPAALGRVSLEAESYLNRQSSKISEGGELIILR